METAQLDVGDPVGNWIITHTYIYIMTGKPEINNKKKVYKVLILVTPSWCVWKCGTCQTSNYGENDEERLVWRFSHHFQTNPSRHGWTTIIRKHLLVGWIQNKVHGPGPHGMKQAMGRGHHHPLVCHQARSAWKLELSVVIHTPSMGGFHQWGYPHSWMLYNGKSY